MKIKQLVLLSTLFSILVSGCITVPRIQKKDAKNNQFSQELQNWFYVSHPQNIDTQTKVKADTSIQYLIDTTWLSNITTGGSGDSTYSNEIVHDSTIYGTWFPVRDTIHYAEIPPTEIKYITKTITKTIHDSIFITVVDVSKINALNNQLGIARDSLTKSILLVATKTNGSLKRLIWAIIASLLMLVFLFLFLKKSVLI